LIPYSANSFFILSSLIANKVKAWSNHDLTNNRISFYIQNTVTPKQDKFNNLPFYLLLIGKRINSYSISILTLKKVWPLPRTSRKTLRIEAPGNCRGKGDTLCFNNGLQRTSLILGLIIDTCLTCCLHQVFPTFQNSRQRIMPIRILNIPPALYPKRRRHPSTLTKMCSVRNTW